MFVVNDMCSSTCNEKPSGAPGKLQNNFFQGHSPLCSTSARHWHTAARATTRITARSNTALWHAHALWSTLWSTSMMCGREAMLMSGGCVSIVVPPPSFPPQKVHFGDICTCASLFSCCAHTSLEIPTHSLHHIVRPLAFSTHALSIFHRISTVSFYSHR